MDEQSFTTWATSCERQLLRSAYLLTGDLHRAEDLVQEALIARGPALVAAPRRSSDGVRPHHHRARQHLVVAPPARDQRGRAGAINPAPSGDPDAAIVVRRALARLTRSQRAVVVLRHFDDLTERETAEVLGVSIGTVKSQNAVALARLRTGAPELLDLMEEKAMTEHLREALHFATDDRRDPVAGRHGSPGGRTSPGAPSRCGGRRALVRPRRGRGRGDSGGWSHVGHAAAGDTLTHAEPDAYLDRTADCPAPRPHRDPPRLEPVRRGYAAHRQRRRPTRRPGAAPVRREPSTR